MLTRILGVACATVMSLGIIVAAPGTANAAVPGSPGSCSIGGGMSGGGTVKAINGRSMYLSQANTNTYLPVTKKAYTKVYTSSGSLMWEVDYRENASTSLTRYYFNRDSQTHSSGRYLVTTFRWIITGATDRSCTAYSRIP